VTEFPWLAGYPPESGENGLGVNSTSLCGTKEALLVISQKSLSSGAGFFVRGGPDIFNVPGGNRSVSQSCMEFIVGADDTIYVITSDFQPIGNRFGFSLGICGSGFGRGFLDLFHFFGIRILLF
jgi:hypothetical protein